MTVACPLVSSSAPVAGLTTGRSVQEAPSGDNSACLDAFCGFQRRLCARSTNMQLECSVMESMMLSRDTYGHTSSAWEMAGGMRREV